MALDPSDDPVGGTPQQVLAHGFDTESRLVEVVAGKRSWRSAEANRFDQGVVAEVIDMGAAAATSLEVNEHPTAAVATRATKAQVDLALHDQFAVVNFVAATHFDRRAPLWLRTQRRKAVEKCLGGIGGIAAQLGSIRFGEMREVVRYRGAVVTQGRECLVDEFVCNRQGAPVHRELDGLVRNRSPRNGHTPRKLSLDLVQVTGFATHDLAQQELVYEYVVASFDVVGDGPQAVGKALSQSSRETVGKHRAMLSGRSEFLNHARLRLVQRKNCGRCYFAHISDSRTE